MLSRALVRGERTGLGMPWEVSDVAKRGDLWSDEQGAGLPSVRRGGGAPRTPRSKDDSEEKGTP